MIAGLIAALPGGPGGGGFLRDTTYDCTRPDGQTYIWLDPLSSIPFASGSTVPDGCIERAAQTPVQQWADDRFGPGSFGKTVAEFNKTMATFWVDTPSPTVADTGTFKTIGAAGAIQNSLWFYALLVMLAGILLKAGMIAWQGRARSLYALAEDLARFLAVSAGGAVVITLVLSAGDEYSKWIINLSTGDDFAAAINKLTSSSDALAAFPLVGQYLLLGFAAIASLIQVVIIFFRGAALIPVIGFWPFSAGFAALMKNGKASYEGITAWLVALCLYKPVAATIYAGGFWLIGDVSAGVQSVLSGVALILLAIVALPAIIRIVSPAADMGGQGAGQTGTNLALLTRR